MSMPYICTRCDAGFERLADLDIHQSCEPHPPREAPPRVPWLAPFEKTNDLRYDETEAVARFLCQRENGGAGDPDRLVDDAAFGGQTPQWVQFRARATIAIQAVRAADMARAFPLIFGR